MLNASYEIDFWGKNRAALRAAEFAAIASRFDREVIVLSTVATVINTYFQILAAQDRLRIARDNVECGDAHPQRLSGADRGRHRDRPRYRAAAIAGGAAARRDPAARSAIAPEHRDACGAARRAAGAPDGARRQPERHRAAARVARPAVGSVAAAAPTSAKPRRSFPPPTPMSRTRARRCSRAFRSPVRAATSAPRSTRCSFRSRRSIRSPEA